jgi:choline kinase
MTTNFLSLAASIGKRIKSKEPRAALSIRGVPVVLRQYFTIRNNFIKDEDFTFTVIAGYKPGKIKRVIKGYEGIKILINENHASTNQAESIRIYLKDNKVDNLIIFHGDLLFIDAPMPKEESTCFYDGSYDFRQDEVGVNIQDGYVNNLSYGLETKWSQMLYLTGKELDLLYSICEAPNFKSYFMTFELINQIIALGGKFKAVPHIGTINEIDSLEDINNLEG